jgi:K+-transporting ATPase KdpF subunit
MQSKLIVLFFRPRGDVNGHLLFIYYGTIFCWHSPVNHGVRKITGAVMNWIYLISGGLTVAVFIYLLVALFYPEKF